MSEHRSGKGRTALLLPVALAAMALTATLWPATAGAAVAETPFVERKLGVSTDYQNNPTISGARVVWQDNRNGNYDIYLYDLVTDTETRITDEAADQTYPAISGTRVVWADMRNGNYDIYLCDISTGVETRITDEAAGQFAPCISGTRVAWADVRNGDLDIYAYDLVTKAEMRITDESEPQTYPSISGARVVWEDYRHGTADIYAYDISTGVETRITDEPAGQYYPGISGKRVAWMDERNGDSDIYLYDLASGTETRITDDPRVQGWPRISGGRVVWQDYNGSDYDVYTYDLATGQETTVAQGTATQEHPSVSGTRIVWQDDRNSNWDVYLAELVLPQAEISGPSVVGYGARVSVRARLTSALGMPLAGRELLVRDSPNGESWHDLGLVVTDRFGTATFTTPPLFAKIYLRAFFAGDAFYPALEGGVAAIKPRALLGIPAAPETMARTKTYTLMGTLKPRHPAGSKLVTLRCYRNEAGHWRLKKTVSASLVNYGAYSRYVAFVRLPLAGSWRLSAYHADADHAATHSGWRYVRVP